MKNQIKTHISLLAFALVALCAPALKASTFSFHVDINTAALTSAANSPFFLDFQLNSGGGLANTVTLSNFSFDNGSATGFASAFGTASGSLSGSITLDDSSNAFNEIFQGFSTTTTGIHFDVVTSQSSSVTTPDEFAAAILDSESGNPQIATNSTDGVSLVTLNIGSANTLADVGAFSSVSPAGVTASVTSAIPEPSTTAALLGGAALMMTVGFRRFSRKHQA